MSRCRTCALIVIAFRSMTTFGGSLLGVERSSVTGGVSMIKGFRKGSWSYKTARDHREAKVFRAHGAPQGTCDDLINALKLLTNQQKDGDSPLQKIASCLLEKKPQQNFGRAQEVSHPGRNFKEQLYF